MRLIFYNLSAKCSVNLSSPATNGGNKYILNAKADFNNGVSESFGIAGGKVRVSGLQYGKSYVFGEKSLTVAEDGTAEVEFTVPDYGYVDKEFPDLYRFVFGSACKSGGEFLGDRVNPVCKTPDKECRGRASGEVSHGKNFLAETVDR